jgi:hypothetical protein
MKQNVLILSIFLFAANCGFTQVKSPVKKLYAYKQASIPGINISTDDNDINDKKTTKKTDPSQNFNYWFYISMSKTEKISITGLWINGKQYDLKSEVITNLPVQKIIYTGVEKNAPIIMVPVTSNKIILVYPVAIKRVNSKYTTNLAKTNELVIRYTLKGKTYYTTTKKIKELTPDVRV